MKKTLALLLVALTVLLALASCKIKDKNDADTGADNTPGSGGTAVVEKGTIFGDGIDPRIIKSKDAPKMSVDEVYEAIYNCSQIICEVRDDGEDPALHEIVIGDSNRAVTAKAKEALASGLQRIKREWEDRDLDTDFLIGYAVYSDGKSVAVVWSEDSARPYAYEYFITNFLNSPKLELEDGFVNVRGIDRIEALRAEEAIADEAVYAKIAQQYSQEVADALKTYLGMFDERYYYWLADLYNPGEYDENGNPLGGGFYYSNSGRDNEGYNIDLESTMQALSWITGSSGMFTGQAQARETLPASMLDELAAFALSCQSSTDGYFYHPQWGDSIGTSRLSRDLGWATQILSYAQVKPYWNTPNNSKGYFGEPNGDDSVKSLTISEYRAILAGSAATSLSTPLSSSTVSAVSKVVATSGTRKWNGSAWLATMEAWEAYLQSYEANIHTSSYSIGNNFSAQSGQINTRDKIAIENGEYPDVRDVYGNPKPDGIADGGYVETWKRYFDSWQYDYNGLWEHNKSIAGYDADGKAIVVDDPNGDPYYAAINGLMKISSCYDSLNVPFNHASEAFNCAVYMCTYLGNGTITGDDSVDWKDVKGKAPTGSVDVYNPWVAMSHILAIVGDTDKVLQAELRKITQDNALEMIKITTKKIGKFSKNDGSFGYTWSTSPANSQGAPVAVPNTVEGDINGGGIAFTGTFGTMRGVLGITGELKPYNYSDGLLFAKRISELSPVVKGGAGGGLAASDETGERNFNDDAPGTSTADGVSTSMNAGNIVITADPNNPKNNYLTFNCVSSDKGGNTVTFPAKQEKTASGLVFEFKLKFDEIPKDIGTGFQITMGSYMFTLGIYANGQFRIGDSSSTGSPNISQWFDAKFNAYEWHKIRVEFYVLDAESRSTVAQIYVDDDLRFVSSNYVGKEKDSAPSLTFKSVKFFSLKAVNCVINLDDVYAAQITTPFVDKPIFNPDLVKDFDKVEAGSGKLPNGVTTTGGTVVSEPTEEKPGNNIFVLDAKNDTVNIGVSNNAAAPNVYAVTTKMRISSQTLGEIGIAYLSGGSATKAMMAYKINVYEEGGFTYASLTEYDKAGKTGNTYKGLPTDEWFTLAIEFYPYFYETDASSIVYLNGTELGRSNHYYYIGTLSATYTYFTVTLSANATVALDDVTPEKIAKKFVNSDGVEVDDPDITLPKSGTGSSTSATATHDGHFDFEGVALGTPKVPGLTTSVNTNEYGYYLDIRQDPTDAANQVLSHIVVPSSSYGNTATYTPSKLSPADANCYVFEFDVLIANGVGGQLQTSINGTIVGSDGKSKTVKMFQTNTILTGTYNNATLQVTSKRDDPNSLGSYTDATAPADSKSSQAGILSTISVSGWVNIRFELYPDQGKVQIYYDGQYRGETSLVYTNQMKATLSSAGVYTVYGANQELYFDNVVVEAIKKDYVAQTCENPKAPAGDGSRPIGSTTPDEPGEGGGETPDTPVVPDVPVVPEGPVKPENFNGTYDFENHQTGTFNVWGVEGEFPIGGYSMVMDDPIRSANKVLQFVTVGRNASGSNEWVDVTAHHVEKAKKYVFEWDMLFERVGSSKTDIIQIKLGTAYMIILAYYPDTNTYSIFDASSTSSKDAWYVRSGSLVSGITANEWHNIKIEYAVVDSRAMIKIYVDGTLRIVSDNHFGKDPKSVSNSEDFSILRFYSTWLGDFTMDIDNVKAYGTTEEIERAAYTHQVHKPDPYAQPTIVEGSVNDFDNVNTIKYDTASPIATYTVVDDPLASSTGEAVNKVLKITQQNASQSFDAHTFPTYNLSDAKNVGAYELSFDMYLDADVPSKETTLIQFIMHSNKGYAMLFSFKYGTDGTFRITQDRDKSGDGVSAEIAKSQKIADGKWHNIRIVVEYNADNSYVSIYVDGTRISRTATYYYGVAVKDGTPLKSVTWRTLDNLESSVETLGYYTLYIDNMYFVYIGDLK